MRYVLAVLAILLAGSATQARAYEDLLLPSVEFEAVAVHEAGRFQTKEKLHYARGRLRIERGNGFAVVILDLSTQTQYLLMANHTYAVTPMDDEYFRRFIARDPKMSGAHRLGTEQIAGLKATKYAFGDEGALDAAGTFWLADNGIMLRRDYDAGVFGANVHHHEFLTDVRIAPQPARLFGIPSDYRRVK
jgi:hypothetical protein